MLHGDVFRHLVQPHLIPLQDDWDNFSEEEQVVGSLTECKALCIGKPDCLQYSFSTDKCRTSKGVKRGIGRTGVTSGWITGRIDAVAQELGSCETPRWITL